MAIPERSPLVVANEADLIEGGGTRSHMMLFEHGEGAAAYPQLTSAGIAQEICAPVGQCAISGMVADDNDMIYAVNDSFHRMQPAISAIDPSRVHARIVGATPVPREGQPAQKPGLEGIAMAASCWPPKGAPTG